MAYEFIKTETGAESWWRQCTIRPPAMPWTGDGG